MRGGLKYIDKVTCMHVIEYRIVTMYTSPTHTPYMCIYMARAHSHTHTHTHTHTIQIISLWHKETEQSSHLVASGSLSLFV